ncbi:MAG TPA: 23S rRNA (adenine(2503)-C(2))-methyltransferase RlmN [Thermoanaerobaculia bacterium]|nr:23S rRNA (adenine(2503)-C(2))-methyltransferase RlmN [Thermoanaerobaculia bacterium]
MTNDRIDLYDLQPSRLDGVLAPIVSPPFRLKQIAEWLYVRGVESFDAMTNLPKDLRSALAERFSLGLPELLEQTEPAPDGSRKYLFRLGDGSRLESVYMPMGDRTSICLSTQAGCAVGCTFCVTGFFGAGRNLTPSEMTGQLLAIRRDREVPPELLNVVFMGMGEPLLNLDHLSTTLDILYTTIAPKRITVSTSGIIPGIVDLAAMPRRPNLAVSINAPDRVRREEIMPITKRYPLDELIATLERYPAERGREITVEYVLLAGYNDSPADARLLAKLIRRVKAKVNAIPFNSDPNLPPWMKRPSDQEIDRFVETLVRNGVAVTVRRSKGRDITAACGQLRGKEKAARARDAGALRTLKNVSS